MLRTTDWERFLPYLAYLEIFASLKGSIFDVLGLVGKDNPGQCLLADEGTVVHLLAEAYAGMQLAGYT